METHSGDGGSKAVIITILALIIILAVAIVLKFSQHSAQVADNYQSKNASNSSTSKTLSSPTPSPKNTDTSDTQLDKDEQAIQSNMDKLDSNETDISTSFNNQSADISQ